MGKKSRKIKTSRTCMGRMLSYAKSDANGKGAYDVQRARMDEYALDEHVINEYISHHLPRARTIVIDPRQALVLADQMEELSGWDVKPPFDYTLISFGTLDGEAPINVKDPGYLLYGILCTPLALLSMTHSKRGDFIDQQSIEYMNMSTDDKKTILSSMFPDVPADDVMSASDLMARIAKGVCAFLECANVELVETDPYPLAHKAAGQPRYVVDIIQNTRRYKGKDETGSVEFDHRFQVRGGWVHNFRLTPEGRENLIFKAWARDKPEKIRPHQATGELCVRTWRSSYIKGPPDKPLVPKIRKIKQTINQGER